MSLAPIGYIDETDGNQVSSIDLLAIARALLRRWKLILATMLTVLMATYGILKLVPSRYKSTIQVLVYDPQQQIDTTVQKPISPFVDAVGYDAMNTQINVLKSKSVALRVATELGLDNDPEFQPHNWLADLEERLAILGWGRNRKKTGQTSAATEEGKPRKLDEAADALVERLQVWPESYIINVSVASQNPVMAQRLATTIAEDYLSSQREARQQALERVAGWLKLRVDDLQSRVLQTEAEIEKVKVESGLSELESTSIREQIRELNIRLMAARADVNEKRAHLEQARRVIETNRDIQSIPELTASVTLTELRQKQMQMSLLATDLEKRLGVPRCLAGFPLYARDRGGSIGRADIA